MSGAREWIKSQLGNWARWAAVRHAGLRQGYPRQSALASLSGPSGYRGGDAMDPAAVEMVNELQAQRVHQALEAWRIGPNQRLWVTVWLVYVGDPSSPSAQRRPMTLTEAAQHLGMSVGGISDRLIRAEIILADALRREPA